MGIFGKTQADFLVFAWLSRNKLLKYHTDSYGGFSSKYDQKLNITYVFFMKL